MTFGYRSIDHNDADALERIIEQLNREQPYFIDEDFTFKRPHGFILDGRATTGITTWRRLYELVCTNSFARCCCVAIETCSSL